MSNKKENSLMHHISDKVLPVAGKIAKQRHIQAISGGLMALIPFTLLGAIFNIIKTPPITADMIEKGGWFVNLFKGWYNFVQKYGDILAVPSNMTMGMMSVIAVFAISYKLAQSYKLKELSTALISLIMFLIIASPSTTAYLASAVSSGTDISKLSPLSVLDITYLGAKGLFVAIVIGLLSTEVTRFCIEKKLVIKMPDSVPPNVAESFSTVIPVLINCLVFYGANLLLQKLTGLSLPEAIITVLTPAINNVNTPLGMIAIITLGNLLWIFGIHGPAVVSMLYIPIYMQITGENLAIVQAGGIAPFQAINMSSFTNPYFGLNLILLFFVTSKQLKAIGKVAFIPGVFLISEPLIFGVPIMFNPILAIPQLLIPAVMMALSWVAGSLGWLTGSYNMIYAQLPIGMNTFLGTMNINNLIFYILMIGVQFIMWLPFIKVYDKQLAKQERENEVLEAENA